MKTITFSIQKGGVGKTTMSVSVAAELAKHGKTLLIDGDSQGNSTTWLVDSLDYELADVLMKKCNVKEAIQPTKIENLFILPTAGVGGELRKYALFEAPTKHNAIKNLLGNVALEGFDYCIFDTSPAFNPMERNICYASDEIVAVLQLDVFSADGMETFTSNIKELREDEGLPSDKPLFNKIVFNARDERLSQQTKFLEDFNKLSGYNYHIVPVDQAFKKAQGLHCSVADIQNVKKETLEAIEKLARSLM